MKLRVATYNIHKGVTGIRRRPRIHDVKVALNTIDADIVFLQEVQDRNEMLRHHANYPAARQLDFLATGGYEHQPNFQRWLQHRTDALHARGIDYDLMR